MIRTIFNALGGAEIRLNGYIVADDMKEIYEWYGYTVTCPKDFHALLKTLDGKQELIVWINSPGGDVSAGSAIYTALKNYAGKVAVKIDGVAVSAASVVAMAGVVQMSPTAEMMIHNPWTRAEGDAEIMRQSAQSLDSCKEAIINAYALKTKMEREVLSAMMDAEKWMNAREACELGFSDGILFDEDGLLATPRAAMNALAMPVSDSMIRAFRKRSEVSAPPASPAKDAEKLLAEIELLGIM